MNELSKLRDLHLPGSVPIFPLAPIWYVLISVILAIFIYGLIRYKRYVYYNLPKKQAYRIIEKVKSHPNHHAKLVQIALILKRVAMHYHGRSKTARLSGQTWIDFLNSTSGKKPLFSKQQAFLLSHLLYEPRPHISETQINNLMQKSVSWIKLQ